MIEETQIESSRLFDIIKGCIHGCGAKETAMKLRDYSYECNDRDSCECAQTIAGVLDELDDEKASLFCKGTIAWFKRMNENNAKDTLELFVDDFTKEILK